jgi:hypothetical protein
MDDERFDAWTRRAFGVAAGGLAATILGLTATDDVDAKKKKRKKKKCKGGKKKCGKKCIPKSNCCTDADCGGGATCQDGTCLCLAGERECEGTCIPEDVCCPGEACGENCSCRRTVEGTGFCVQGGILIACVQCNSSAECEAGDQCVQQNCGGATAVCVPPCEVE